MSSHRTNHEISLGWDPGRVLFGLSRIGYTPPSAICDIIDNSVRANASLIKVLIRKERDDLSDRRRNNVNEYVVIDDGIGMNASEMADALKLGAPGEQYEDGSLSKFGLGLKSAALSQGNTLQLISASDSSSFRKYVVSLPKVKKQHRYFAYEEDISDDDRLLIGKHLNNGRGTIVRISDVRKENHPSVKSTVEELEYKIGVIYYYYLRDELRIEVDDHNIKPFDILFTNEADKGGKLDESEWKGKSVCWIQKTKDILLDQEHNVNAKLEITQLPYPPIFGLEESGKDAEIRKIYRIEAGNYGFYVYRNKRLISWAERFGIITQHGDFYGFRGRLLIDESADEAFNIDVKESSITLSEDAARTLDDYSAQYKRKSRMAWANAISIRKEREGQDPNLMANQLADDYSPPESLPGQSLPSADEAQEQNKRDSELQKEMRDKMREEAAQRKKEQQNGEDTFTEDEVTDEDIDDTLRETSNPASRKIFRVTRIKDNSLWEPYHDAEYGPCVRINKFHRFSQLVYDSNHANTDLQIIFELFVLQAAHAEVYSQKHLLSHDRSTVQAIIGEHRRVLSEYLADMCRKLEESLPRSEE